MACKAKFNVGESCIGGDFNAIKRVNERKIDNLVIYSAEMTKFMEFIINLDLVDVPLA